MKILSATAQHWKHEVETNGDNHMTAGRGARSPVLTTGAPNPVPGLLFEPTCLQPPLPL